MRRLFIAFTLMLLAQTCVLAADLFGPKTTPEVKTEHVKAELIVHAPEGVQPGGKFWVGLSLEHAPHWHTYWKNSGDSGLPTTLVRLSQNFCGDDRWITNGLPSPATNA